MAWTGWLKIWINRPIEVKFHSRLTGGLVVQLLGACRLQRLVSLLTQLRLPPLVGRWRGISKAVKAIRVAYFPIGWKVVGGW